jgi:hypothetical protein
MGFVELLLVAVFTIDAFVKFTGPGRLLPDRPTRPSAIGYCGGR